MASISPAGFSTPELRSAQAPQHYSPPTARELRAQAMHRLQIGVFGLASMLLLVMLASVIMERARGSEEARMGQAVATSSATPGDPDTQAGDPLADIGVVPDLPDQGGATPGASPSGDVP